MVGLITASVLLTVLTLVLGGLLIYLTFSPVADSNKRAAKLHGSLLGWIAIILTALVAVLTALANAVS